MLLVKVDRKFTLHIIVIWYFYFFNTEENEDFFFLIIKRPLCNMIAKVTSKWMSSGHLASKWFTKLQSNEKKFISLPFVVIKC